MSIFISHSSRDKVLIDQFVKEILVLGCGIKQDLIYCTSIEGLGIRNGEDFREHIKIHLKQSKYAFVFISNNYKNSEVCMNEMGACWAFDHLHIKQFLFPNLDFGSLGLLLNVKQASKIEDTSALDELHEELISKYDTKVSVTLWNKYKGDFLKIINEYARNNANTPYPHPRDYFYDFIKENASPNYLLSKAHPTLLDCKSIFSEEYYLKAFNAYCHGYEDLNNKHLEPFYPKYKHLKITKSSVLKIRNGENTMPGGISNLVVHGVFNSNVEFYSVTFLENKSSEHGNRYSVFCYVNNRWVFIPKPWRFVEVKSDYL